MKKLLTKKSIFQSALVGLALFGIESCTVNPTSPTDGGSNIAMRTQLDNVVVHSGLSGHASTPDFGSVDSLQVTSAAFAASNFTLRSDVSDDQPDPNLAEGNIRPPQFLLAFDVSGRQYIGESIIFSSTYRRARFDIHALVGSPDSLAFALGPLYTSLFKASTDIPANTTIVIHGNVWKSGIQTPFTYRSAYTGSGSVYSDQPLVVTTGSPMEVLVRFSSQTAFTDGTGMILDPRDVRNAAAIEANLRTSLKASPSIAGS